MNEQGVDQQRAKGFCVHGNKPPCEACNLRSIETSEVNREALVEAKKQQLTEGYPNTLHEYREVHLQPGMIADLSEENPYNESLVKTGTAVIFESSREIASGLFYGCAALFLFDGTKTLLAHMTTGDRLSWLGSQLTKDDSVDRQYVDHSLNSIIAAANKAGMNLSKTTFTLIAEPGISPRKTSYNTQDKYSIESTEESFAHVHNTLSQLGVTKGKVVKSAVSHFAVVYSPEGEGIFVTGFKNEYKNGVLQHSNKKENVKTNYIPVDLPTS